MTQVCPINTETADGVAVGRCWLFLPDGATCPRHGDVSQAVRLFIKTGRLTLERDLPARRPAGNGQP